MTENVQYTSLSSRLVDMKWKPIIYCAIGACIIIIITSIKFNFTPIKMNYSNLILSAKHSKKQHSIQLKSIPMPCIEPHCIIQCYDTYANATKDGIIDGDNLSEIQRQHLMIDMNKDKLVNDLINSIPPPKICPSREQNTLSTSDSSNTVTFYPLIFGFADHFLMSTLSRELFLGNKFYQIDEICLPIKSKDFDSLVPGQGATYRFRFGEELEYRRSYSTSYFALTKKKSGWDCNRHYEIISTGTMPYFDHLDQAGDHTLSHLPKSLLYEAQKIPGVNRQNRTIDHKIFDIDQYYLLLHRLLYYAKHRLTTNKIVEYILNVTKYSINSSSQKPVLYLSHFGCDYMKDFMLNGFTRVLEENLHVFQPPRYMYQFGGDQIWKEKEASIYFDRTLYGAGYAFMLTLTEYAHLYERDIKELSTIDIVKQNIINKKYSLIVFGSIFREGQLLPLVKQHYDKSQIIIIDGEDIGKFSQRSELANNAYYFLREIPNDCNSFM